MLGTTPRSAGPRAPGHRGSAQGIGNALKGARGWQGASQSIQTVRGLFQAVSLAQVVVDLAVLHAGVWRLAPCSNLPHGHSEGPLWEAQREGVSEGLCSTGPPKLQAHGHSTDVPLLTPIGSKV